VVGKGIVRQDFDAIVESPDAMHKLSRRPNIADIPRHVETSYTLRRIDDPTQPSCVWCEHWVAFGLQAVRLGRSCDRLPLVGLIELIAEGVASLAAALS
jgi:hypothetical protein